MQIRIQPKMVEYLLEIKQLKIVKIHQLNYLTKIKLSRNLLFVTPHALHVMDPMLMTVYLVKIIIN
jgi:hypothetical protein